MTSPSQTRNYCAIVRLGRQCRPPQLASRPRRKRPESIRPQWRKHALHGCSVQHQPTMTTTATHKPVVNCTSPTTDQWPIIRREEQVLDDPTRLQNTLTTTCHNCVEEKWRLRFIFVKRVHGFPYEKYSKQSPTE